MTHPLEISPEEIADMATNAQMAGQNDLAIILFTTAGSMVVGGPVLGGLATMAQGWAAAANSYLEDSEDDE